MSNSTTGETEAPPAPTAEPAHVEELIGGLDELAAAGESAGAAQLTTVRELLAEAHKRGILNSEVKRLDRSDVAEAFVGSVIFASPLLIEDGVYDIASYLFDTTVAGVPVFLLANTLFVVVMTYALLEWTGRDKREATTFFGIVPARVVMILGVSVLVATLLMTVWGRVDGWTRPLEAIARINVIWTVGSLGAALGDILSGQDTAPAADQYDTETGSQLSDGELVSTIHTQFDDLEAVTTGADRELVEQLRQRTAASTIDDAFGDSIRKYTGRDIVEGFVGSVFFSIGFLVEDGVYDVAAYFLSFRIGFFPVFFLANAAFVLAMIWGLVYWAGPQDVKAMRPILGVVPRRLVGIALVSYLTAAALMTMWGRVADWNDPVVAMARISVVWTVASFGAALGDILPGESSGADINDDLAVLVDGEKAVERSD